MGGFNNPLAGAAGALIIPQLKSPNYIPGVQGWIVRRDGSVEFNNGLFRGGLVVGSPPSFFEISGTVPAELVTFYSTFYTASVTQFEMRIVVNATSYYYWVAFESNPSGTFVAEAEGWVISGVVKEAKSTFFVPGAPVGQKTQTNFNLRNSSGYVAFGQLGAVNLGTVFFQDVNMSWNHSNQPSADWTIDGVSQERGLSHFEQITTSVNSGAVAGTEYGMFTSAAFTFVNGRAYKVRFAAQKKSAALQNFGCNIRQNSAVGPLLISGGREPITTVGNDLAFFREGFVVNTSGADVSRVLVFCVIPQVATLVTIEAAAGAGAGFWYIKDAGAATDYAGALSLV